MTATWWLSRTLIPTKPVRVLCTQMMSPHLDWLTGMDLLLLQLHLWLQGTAFLLELLTTVGFGLFLSLSRSPAAPIPGKWNVEKPFSAQVSQTQFSGVAAKGFMQEPFSPVLRPATKQDSQTCCYLAPFPPLAMPRWARAVWSPLVTQLELSKLKAPFSKLGNRITCTLIFINS